MNISPNRNNASTAAMDTVHGIRPSFYPMHNTIQFEFPAGDHDSCEMVDAAVRAFQHDMVDLVRMGHSSGEFLSGAALVDPANNTVVFWLEEAYVDWTIAFAVDCGCPRIASVIPGSRSPDRTEVPPRPPSHDFRFPIMGLKLPRNAPHTDVESNTYGVGPSHSPPPQSPPQQEGQVVSHLLEQVSNYALAGAFADELVELCVKAYGPHFHQCGFEAGSAKVVGTTVMFWLEECYCSWTIAFNVVDGTAFVIPESKSAEHIVIPQRPLAPGFVIEIPGLQFKGSN